MLWEPRNNTLNPVQGTCSKEVAFSMSSRRCLYIILYLGNKGEGERRDRNPLLAQPTLFRGVFTHLWACQDDIVSALPRAIHLTFKPFYGLGPPEDPTVRRLTFSGRGGEGGVGPPSALRLVEGRWHVLCSGLPGHWCADKSPFFSRKDLCFLKI